MQRFLLWLGCLTLLALTGPLATAAQPNLSTEPTEVGVLTRRIKTGSFQTLELCNSGVSSEFSIFLNGCTFYRIPGSHSSVRFTSQEPIEFFLRSFLDTSDPRAAFFPVRDPNLFELFQCEVEDESRKVILSDQGFASTTTMAGRPLTVKLAGSASFSLSPTGALGPGEYVIRYPLERDHARLFCFGVDPAPERP